jgi:tetratricopeptide (TPR) repeat protein
MNLFRTALLLVFVLAALSPACAGGKHATSASPSMASLDAEQLADVARDAALTALRERNRGKSRDMAERGRVYADRCLASAPDDVACRYWRAVNVGLYYRSHIIGYQSGIKIMIADCDKIIAADPRYDHAGAYRMLGEIYTQLPQTGGRADSITRDLDLAERNLRKAVELDPNYPENQLALAETLFAQEKNDEASAALEKAKQLTPQWRSDASYRDWRETQLSLEKKVLKIAK